MPDRQDYAQQLPRPSIRNINTGLSPSRPDTLQSLLGRPRKSFDQECRPVTQACLKRMMVTRSVGPFRVTGLEPAVDSLHRVLRAAGRAHPELINQLGTAGMLCCRLVRGSSSKISNHSWGTAVDLTVRGQLNPMGSETVQRGLLLLYYHFHQEGWYWGAGFRRRDAMHFEVAEETIRRWFG